LTAQVLHSAAGLLFDADRRVPGLALSLSCGPADVTFLLEATPPWSSQETILHYIAPYAAADGRPAVSVRGGPGGFHFEYADGTNVWIDLQGRQVWCTWPSAATLEDTATYLTGPILGFVLRLRGMLALHASAVQIADSALILVGPHGAGKSSTAAGLAMQGCPVIADDVVRVRRTDHEWMAEPCGTTIRLWPDGARIVFGRETSLPRITPTWDKRALHTGSSTTRAVLEAVRVGGIVFLEPRERSDAPKLVPVSAAEAVVRLATHGSASHLLDDEARQREFTEIAQLVRGVPCARAIPVEDERLYGTFVSLVHEWGSQFDRARPVTR
jgi:hypothetical protein